MRPAWPDNFPNVFVHTKWHDAAEPCLATHRDFERAKYQGDADAAARLLNDLIEPRVLDDLVDRFGPRDPLVVAPSVSPGNENNALATTHAVYLKRALEIEHCTTIIQTRTIKRDKSSKWVRISNPSQFTGFVPARDFIIADDVYTSGGTMADLRSFIEMQGGRVIAMTAIATRSGSYAPIAIQPATKMALAEAYGADLDEFWLEEFGYGIESFTEREARHLLEDGGSFQDIRRRVLGLRAR